MIGEKIKNLRKANNMTQEDLAEKLHVSRQAVTKWESGAGAPDISNIEAIAKLFDISVDELLSDGSAINKENISRTEFDIFSKSSFHLDVGTANSLDVTTADMEKVIVEVRSDMPTESYKLAKVRLTEGKRVDLVVVEYKSDKKFIDVKTEKDFSKQDAKNHLFIKMVLPEKLAEHIELEGNVQNLRIHDMSEDRHIEFDGKASNVNISDLKGHFELTGNVDMEVTYDGSMRQLDINQLRCVSNLYLTKDSRVDVYNKGRCCKVLFDNYENSPESDRKVEFNGYKSELTVKRK